MQARHTNPRTHVYIIDCCKGHLPMAECVIADKLTIHCGGLGGVLYILVVMSHACHYKLF